MKKFITLLFLALMLAGMYETQAQTVTIGTGTATSYFYGPIYRSSSTSSFDYSKYDYLFLASELSGAGIPSGATISKVAWNKSSTSASTGNAAFSVWIKNSAQTTLVSGSTWGSITSGATQAYVTTTQTIPGVTGWVEFTFASPFTYTGGSLEIATDWNCSMISGNPSTGSYPWYYSSGLAFNGTIGWASNVAGSDATALQTATYGGTLRPNIQITYTPGTTPYLSSSPGSKNFGYVPSGGTSTEQLFNLSGGNLTGFPGTILITAPPNFQVSLTSGGPWTNSVNMPYTGASLPATPYYAVFQPTGPPAAYSGNITCVGGGASLNVPVSGTSYLYAWYCTSTATSAADEDIFNVTVGTLNNTSTCTTLAPGPGSVVAMYSNYTTSVTPPDLGRGNPIGFSIQIGTCGGNYSNAVKIFIDYNQDGDFADTGEEVYVSPVSTSGPHTETGSFTVPPTATLGNTMMRVVNVETGTPSGISACGTYTWGETEDYLVNIVAGASCLAPVNLTATNIQPTQADLGWTESGTATTWDIEWGAQGFTLGTGTQILGVTSNPYTLFGLTQNSPYAFYVRADCGGGDLSAWSGPMNFATPCGPNAVPYSQYFPDATWPSCWTQTYSGGVTSNRWSMNNSANAGGTAYEAYANWVSGIGISRLISPPINTTGLTSLNVAFKTFYDDYGAGVTCKLQTSTNLITWTDVPGFSLVGGAGNYGPADVLINVAQDLGGTTYIAWVIDGDHYQYDAWYVDNVVLSVPVTDDVGFYSFDNLTASMPNGIYQPKVTFKNYGTDPKSFDVNLTIVPGYSSTKTITGLGSGLTQQVTFDDWNATPGNYTITACSQLATDMNPANDCGTINSVVYEANTAATWSTGADIPTGSYLGSGASYASIIDGTNYVFAVGGNTATGTELFKYNVNTNTWETKAPLPAGRRVLGSAVVGDYLYAIAGSDMASVYQSTVYRYDIIGDVWTTVAPLPVALGWVKAVSYNNNYIYVAGGVDAASTVVNTVYLYTVSTDTWTTATPLPGAIFGGAFAINGDLLTYVAGADAAVISDVVYVGDIDDVDPAVIVWGTRAPYPGVPAGLPYMINVENAALSVADPLVKTEMPEPTDLGYPGGTMFRFDGATWQGGRIIVGGGSPTATWTPANPNPCYSYDPVADTWVRYTDLPTPVLGPCVGSADMGGIWKFIVATGYTGTSVITTTQILTEDFLACVMPTGLQAIPDVNSALLSWNENGTATLWDIEYGDQGFTLGTGTQVLGVTNPYNLGSLLENHNYAYYVRSDCGGTQSAWSGPKNFTTLCSPVTVLPHTESFTTWPPSCWFLTGGTRNWAQYAAVPCAYANFWSWTVPNNAIMTSQAVDLSGYTGAHLVFKWSHLYMSAYPTDQLIVSISTNGGGSWTELWNITGAAFDSQDGAGTTTPGTFVTKVLDLTPYIGSTVLIRFNAVSGYGPDLFLDEVLITDTKHVNVKLMLEGLWNGTGMNEAQDEFGSHWGPGVADRINIELHDAVAPYNLLGTIVDVDVATDGTTDRILGCEWGGPYYLAIAHRNSIYTWSAAPVNFLAYPVVYDFSTANTQAYGNNQQNLGGGVYGIYGGDVNQDLVVDSNDMGDVDNDSNSFVMGYVATDANGDGVVDSNDMGLVDNNANSFVMAITP